MTISSQTSSITLEGDGSNKTFAFDFEISYQPDGVTPAALVQTIGANGQLTTLTLTTDYTVSGVGNALGGSVTYPVSGSALPIGQYIRIKRDLEYTQESSYPNQGLLPETIETGMDALAMQIQQLAGATPSVLAPCLTADLPAAQLSIGIRGMALDSSVTLFGLTLVGGGTNVVPVVSNGEEWIVG